MPIQFAREPLTAALWADAEPLLRAHYDEISAFKDIPLEPDVQLYMAGEAAGILRVFTARMEYDCEEARYPLVGYALYFVRPNPHYKSSLQANQDVIYLAPSVRGKTGLNFLAWCDSQLAAEGVQVVYQHLKVKADHARLMALLGYEPVDTIYAKRLDAVSVEPVLSPEIQRLRAKLAESCLREQLAAGEIQWIEWWIARYQATTDAVTADAIVAELAAVGVRISRGPHGIRWRKDAAVVGETYTVRQFRDLVSS